MNHLNKYLRPILFVLAFLMIWSFLSQKKGSPATDDIVLQADNKIAIGKEVVVTIQNNTQSPLIIPSECPKNPLTVEAYANGEWSKIEAKATVCQTEALIVEAGKSEKISYGEWNHELFGKEGKYRLSLEQSVDEKSKIYSTELMITPPGTLRTFFLELFYKPIFNTLIFLVSIMPGHSLGWAIIVLTLIIKLILLAPNQKALKAQKKIQKIQPQLDALKNKYKDDPKKLAEETMLIWKKYKVNPTSSCLPMLIQLPILIALFYVVKDGLHYINPQMLYAGLKTFDTTLIQTIFLNIVDLTQKDPIVLPIIIGLLQFGQMKLAIGKTSGQPDSPIPSMNKTMMYIMPLMIAFFTAASPAAVGFYWGTSTLFGIIQQFIVNRSKD